MTQKMEDRIRQELARWASTALGRISDPAADLRTLCLQMKNTGALLEAEYESAQTMAETSSQVG